jgi:hypothetical protein
VVTGLSFLPTLALFAGSPQHPLSPRKTKKAAYYCPLWKPPEGGRGMSKRLSLVTFHGNCLYSIAFFGVCNTFQQIFLLVPAKCLNIEVG